MTENIYLGISLGFNASACVVSDQRGLLAAVSQERMSGEKNTKEVPFDAMLECIRLANVSVVDKICISHYEKITEKYFVRYSKHKLYGNRWEDYIFNFLASNNVHVVSNDIARVNHHVAHQYSTFGFYGYPENDNYYMISSDGFGDGLSAKITHSKDGVVSTVKLENSVALVYQFVTGALGFKEHQHEGKITGLAAYGKPIYLLDFLNCYTTCEDENGLSFENKEYLSRPEMTQVLESAIIDFDKFLLLKKTIYNLVADLMIDGAKREDIAASVQEFAEKITLDWIRKYCTKGGNAYLSGGLFANVKINQRIKDMGIFDEVYVCPAMGDEGTAVGAAIFTSEWRGHISNYSKRVISGSEVDHNTYNFIKDYLEQNALWGYKVSVTTNPIADIVERLSDNKIVCLMRDKMEFGPRALCHRSILYNCDTKETNDWLNKKLSRTEFMPFAPVCREEVADDLFKNLDGGRTTAKFMTMTFDCKDEFVKDYPAACHIDNTARPQIVSNRDDEFMWEVLKGYQDKTGKKALINTSFNLHNWPIIRTAEVGLKSWITSDTDCLVIGNVIVEKK